MCLIRAMVSRSSSANGRGRRGLAIGPAGDVDSVPGTASVLTTPGPETALGSSLPKAKAAAITPRRSNFPELVLHSRGIFVDDTSSIVPSAFAHFSTTEPQKGYSNLEYTQMRGRGLCEEEFATLAKETFLVRRWRCAEVSQDRQWRAERMLQLVCLPGENAHWRMPPILGSNAAAGVAWKWDVRPDCAYWLSLKAFNPRYRYQIQNCAFVRDDITCPYFTIEFKRDGQSEDVAIRQVIAAGSLALYNRWRLYSEARRVWPNLAVHTTNLWHYAPSSSPAIDSIAAMPSRREPLCRPASTTRTVLRRIRSSALPTPLRRVSPL